jgi:hypothetical protein
MQTIIRRGAARYASNSPPKGRQFAPLRAGPGDYDADVLIDRACVWPDAWRVGPTETEPCR